MRKLRGLLLSCLVVGALAVCGAFPVSASASVAGGEQLGHAGRWFTDAGGRVLVMHGVNMVYKLAPYYPAAAGFGASDAAYLQKIGLTAVRVGVIWKAVEPEPGVFDDAYLDQIAATVRALGQHGIVSILDFHQDQMNEQFLGEGFPDWAVDDGGLPNTMAPFPGGYETNPALERAFDNFWADAPGPDGIGLQEYYAAVWKHVAQHFAGNPYVLGYELINEPFPGSDYLSCAVGGCPTSDAELTSLYTKVDHAIRSVDHRTLIFYEPYVTFNFGYQDNVGAPPDPNAVFAWHNYCLNTAPCASNTTDFENAQKHIASNREAEFMTEFGDPTDYGDNALIVSRADQNMVSWTNWAYCTCGDPTGGANEGIVKNPRAPKTGQNPVRPDLDSIVEPYPHIIAGTPRSYGYTHKTKTFRLSYSTARASGTGKFPAGSVTEIQTPAFDYPSGYAAHVSGGAIVSAKHASVLEVASCPGATHVAVTVAPGNGASGSCRPHLRIGVRPRGVQVGQLATYRFTVTAALGAYSARVPDALLAFAGLTARTNTSGHAALQLTLNASHSYTATARAAGYITGQTRLKAR